MRNTHGTRFRIAAAVLGLLLSAPPGAALAVVSELSLTNVPPDTKVTLIGEDRSDRVEARTKEQGGDGRLSFQLQERNWPSGSYILNIYEPAGALVSELIELKDGGNEIDLATILGAPLVSTAGSASAAQPNPGVAGATASGVAVGRGGEARLERRQEEFARSDDERRSRGGGRAAAGAAVGSALLGALASSLFGGPSKAPPAEAAAPAAAPAPVAEFVADRVLATIAL